ncbi:MAG: Holliday junction DNA helicase RuvA [Clostridiales bacterium GWF2_38_85]|nr:MAG: Holliday junction DNA helicase RuvA [Clostridiales bacterium GWF2_38_85]HBL83506.1 Holliday junction branch migration protein RuvA [Clostridiales bacterium]
MYYYINGNLVELNQTYAAIDCGGVCYKLNISMSTFSKLSPLVGKKALLYTYLNVKEDVLELYGFYDNEEKTAFVHLISVSGVGPKAAISILSAMNAQSFALAVFSNDPKAITKAQGVGLKTAQKIIIELKDKIAKDFTASDNSADMINDVPGKGVISDAISALVVLGYSRSDALGAIRKVNTEQPLENIIRDSLKQLVKSR